MKEKNLEKKEREGIVITTDLLANLCTELAVVFKSLSKIARTCLGLKDQLRQTSELIKDSITSSETAEKELTNEKCKCNI